jgi:dipeptidyl aminopeptidase/acylaminoacyl peptidase
MGRERLGRNLPGVSETTLRTLPYGSWPTPITSELVVRAAARLGTVQLDGEDVWWDEARPEDGGRAQLVRWRPGEASGSDILPDGSNARSAVHEYGGAAWWVRGGQVWYVDWSDQRLRQLDTTKGAGAEPVVVTPEPEVARGDRWADGDLDPTGRWLVVVREHHPADDPADAGTPENHPAAGEARNEIVVLDTTGEVGPRVLVSGPDFVSDPRFSPDGTRLCWLQWYHPNLPWDGTQLCVSGLRWGEVGPGLMRPSIVAGTDWEGDVGESVFQPRWSDDGSLWFVSDRTGWWNLYRWSDQGLEPMVQMDAEIALPQWVFGQSRYAFLADGQGTGGDGAAGQRVVFAYVRDGLDHLGLREADGTIVPLDLPYTTYGHLQAAGDEVVCVAGSTRTEPAVVRLRFGAPAGGAGGSGTPVGEPQVLRRPRDLGLGDEWFSQPEPISFPTSGGRTAHALYYPPTNPEVTPPPGELPPLLVLIHGGPTHAARPLLQLGTQYWTSRGFAVADVNYGGSTGYGRAYRDQLRGAWGVVDLDDCEAAARWLAAEGRVDPRRLCIRGGSAGGYTTLAALAFRDTFAAGASHYGIADLEALATDTHKFESRYLDTLVGPYPEARDVYVARSPIHHLDGFDRPLAVFQGLEDKIVPPNQAEMIVDALRRRGVPVAYVAFEGEQHGFRQAPNIRRALDGELSFYAQIFGFDLPPGEGIDPVPVENLVT